MKVKVLFTFCMIISFVSISAFGQDSQNIELIRQLKFGEAYDVYTVIGYSYLCTEGGLIILDVKNPSSITEIGRIEIDEPLSVYVSGNFAYVAAGKEGLKIIDITDPADPKETGKLDTMGNAEDICVLNTYAYIADGEAGLRIIDISDSKNPKEVGSFDTTGDAKGIFIAKNQAFIADGSSGLWIADITNPMKPKAVGVYDIMVSVKVELWFSGSETKVSYETERLSAYAVCVSGNYAYVAAGNGLVSIDVSQPRKPSLKGYFAIPGKNIVTDVFVSKSYAYVTAGQGGLWVIDISNPINLQMANMNDTPGNAKGIYISNNLAYIADGDKGFCIIDVSDANLQTLGSFHSCFAIREIHIFGNYAYCITTSKNSPWVTNEKAKPITLVIMDVSDIRKPRIISYYNLPGIGIPSYKNDNDQILCLSEKYAYIAANGLRIIDISDIKNVHEVGFYEMENIDNLRIIGNYVYAHSGNYKIWIFDVSNPQKPINTKFIEDIPTFDISNKYLCCIGSKGYRIFDISNPIQPHEIATTKDYEYDTDMIYVSSNYVYAVSSDRYFEKSHKGFVIIDISDPTKPKTIGNYGFDSRSVGDIKVNEFYAYMYVLYKIQVFNISDPTKPNIICSYGLGQPNWFDVIKSYIYVSTYEDDLLILKHNF